MGLRSIVERTTSTPKSNWEIVAERAKNAHKNAQTSNIIKIVHVIRGHARLGHSIAHPQLGKNPGEGLRVSARIGLCRNPSSVPNPILRD